jgi:hypothetical protein
MIYYVLCTIAHVKNKVSLQPLCKSTEKWRFMSKQLKNLTETLIFTYSGKDFWHTL